MAMGGAFTAVEDRLAAMAWNPAGLLPPECHRGSNYMFHLNLLGAPAIVRETGLLTGVETEPYASLPPLEKLTVALGSVVKGATYRRGGLALGVLLLEEHLDPVGLSESKGLADASALLDAYYTNFVVSFRLHPTVAIGATASIFADWDEDGNRRYGGGRVYGAILTPNDKVRAALTYYDADSDHQDTRLSVEGFSPRTMNGGIAYRPIPGVLLSFDLRDLTEEHGHTALEPRAGVEWNLWGTGAVRAGGYREEGGDSGVLTLGLGAIPMTGCMDPAMPLPSDAFVLNYAVLLTDGEGPRHLLSALLRF